MNSSAMSPRQHLSFLVQGVAAWAVFWVLGWPNYYQQYDAPLIGAASVLLQGAIGVWAVMVLSSVPTEKRMTRAVWLAFYFSVPFAALDVGYCAVFRGHGVMYLAQYWYLTVFYLSVWVALPPTAWALNRVSRKA